MTDAGIVYIVGAGPGDPELITVRGLECLRSADVILHDRLIDTRLLAERDPGAELINVGKKPGDDGSKQNLIDELMVGRARLGQKVCRLKGGDPFVFGRGGEEAQVLTEAGVSFEIVPGVTSAIAAPAAAGIPVTHRDTAHSFMVMTGSRVDEASPEEWEGARSLIEGQGTLVCLMGLSRLSAIVARLQGIGCPLETPTAVVSKGTCQDQESRFGTLADIVSRSKGISSPAVIVVGAVVAEQEKMKRLRESRS